MAFILITGGAGFIGSHLTRLALEQGHRVRVLDNLTPQVHSGQDGPAVEDGFDFIEGDITVRSDVERALVDIDTIVHLAAETGTGQSMYEIDRYYRVNVQGTAMLFDVLSNSTRHRIGNFILASSRSVYGEGAYLCFGCDPAGARRFPGPRTREQLEAHQWTSSCPRCGGSIEPAATEEDDPLDPSSIYAATKLAQEGLVRTACAALQIPFSILRLQNVYGEGQSLTNPYTGILSIFSTRIRRGQSLPVFEDGEETRDFVHVTDVARATLAAIDAPQAQGATLNVGSGRAVTIVDMARALQRALGGTVEPNITGEYRVGDIRHNFASIARLKNVLGFAPEVGLEQGLERFARWVEGQPLAEDRLDKANAELKARKLMA